MKKLQFLSLLTFLGFLVGCAGAGIDVGDSLCSLENTCEVKADASTIKVETTFKVPKGGISGLKGKEIEIKMTGVKDEKVFFSSLAKLNVPIVLPEKSDDISVLSTFDVNFGSKTDYVEIKKDLQFSIPTDSLGDLAIPASAIPSSENTDVGGAKYLKKDFKTNGWMGVCTLFNGQDLILSIIRANRIYLFNNEMFFNFKITGTGLGLYIKCALLYGDPETTKINGRTYKDATQRADTKTPEKIITGAEGQSY